MGRIIVSSIEDSMLAIRQYFHISNFRWDSLRHLNGDSINITNTIDNQNTLDGSLLGSLDITR